MTPAQIAVDYAVQVALALLVAGLLLRRRRCRAFTAYAMVVLISEFSVLFWPRVFWVYGWYIARQTVYSVLKLAVAAELATAMFARFPGAQRTAKRVTAAGLLVTFASLTALPDGGDYRWIFEGLLPRLSNGTLWLFTALAAVASWYVIPISPMHRAILFGCVVYGVPFTVLHALMGLTEWTGFEAFQALGPVAYLLTVCYWAWSAWTVAETEQALALERLLMAAAWN